MLRYHFFPFVDFVFLVVKTLHEAGQRHGSPITYPLNLRPSVVKNLFI
jgi:hypothetical protein